MGNIFISLLTVWNGMIDKYKEYQAKKKNERYQQELRQELQFRNYYLSEFMCRSLVEYENVRKMGNFSSTLSASAVSCMTLTENLDSSSHMVSVPTLSSFQSDKNLIPFLNNQGKKMALSKVYIEQKVIAKNICHLQEKMDILQSQAELLDHNIPSQLAHYNTLCSSYIIIQQQINALYERYVELDRIQFYGKDFRIISDSHAVGLHCFKVKYIHR